MKRELRSRKGLAVAGALLVCGALRADMGSVWVEAVSADSIQINWSDPSVGHRLDPDVLSYTVSWEPAGSYPYSLPVPGAKRTSRTISKKPFAVSPLSSDTAYHITVEARAQKLSVFGEWIHAKNRLVGAVRQRTAAAEPGPVLRVIRTTPDSITVELANPGFDDIDEAHFVYKDKWNDAIELNALARQGKKPNAEAPVEVHMEPSHGWKEELSVSATLRVTFSGLSPAKRYEFVVYGFSSGDAEGVFLAGAMGRTAGFAPTSTPAECIARDHRALFDIYAGVLADRYAPQRVIDRVSPCNEDLYRIRPILSRDEGDDLGDDALALQYLVAKQGPTFACWQEAELAAGGETLERFLSKLPPDLSPVLEGEIDAVPPVFQRGDSDRNGVLEISDSIRVLAFLFLGGATMHCEDAADANDNGGIDLSDGVFLLSFLYGGGPQPPAPHGACGPDETPDGITCQEYSGCSR